MKSGVRWAIFAIALALMQPDHSAGGQISLRPADEGAGVDSFQSFRQQFATALRDRDVARTMQLVDDHVLMARDDKGDAGLFKLALPDHWSDLEVLLGLGGRFVGQVNGARVFCAPYVYCAFPAQLPPGLAGERLPWVVLGSNVRVRKLPSPSSPVVGILSHELVRFLSNTGTHPNAPEWVQIEFGHGQRGFVSGALIRDPANFHACFAEVRGSWRLTEFFEDEPVDGRLCARASRLSVHSRPMKQGEEPASKLTRDRLLAAIRARDVATVLAIASTKVRDRFEEGIALPKSAFAGNRESSDWMQLERVLGLGGTFTTTRGSVFGRREFCAPYVYSAYPERLPATLEGENDPWVVLGPRVAVRETPSSSGRVLAHLDHELVKAEAGPETPDGTHWAKVLLRDGQRGFVADNGIRARTDYHACFAQIDGRWLLTEFGRDRSE